MKCLSYTCNGKLYEIYNTFMKTILKFTKDLNFQKIYSNYETATEFSVTCNCTKFQLRGKYNFSIPVSEFSYIRIGTSVICNSLIFTKMQLNFLDFIKI